MPKSVLSLTLAFLAATFGVVAADASGAESCPDDFSPILAEPPNFPKMLHNEFEGEVLVEVRIDARGAVTDATILESRLAPVGNAGGEPEGYEEAIKSALVRWRFPKGVGPCVARTTVEVQFSD